MIVVQTIQVTWTKMSRGGEGARIRNGLSDAFEVPGQEPGEGILIHWNRMQECNDFVRESSHSFCTDLNSQWDELRIVETPLHLVVEFEALSGIPIHGRPPISFKVPHGSWVKLLVNRRLTDYDTGQWSYQRDTMNIAYVDFLEKEFFLTQPAHRVVDLQTQLR